MHDSTKKSAAILEKGWTTRIHQGSLRKGLVEINITATSFKGILEKSRKHAVRCMANSFAYAKDKWDKSHATPDLAGDLALNGENSVEGELSEEVSTKHPTFPGSLIKASKSGDSEKFLFRNKVPKHIPPVQSSGVRELLNFSKKGN
ncbi:hypothetical protein O181_015123 [Austropuccinia psidii MF-1]|uniref:Uncharacterized protein n=1 Tax=Austropuccinia psidii MF-1 TaxID=1389203 RepID=A0A9Q3C2K2_9BASI|nr:hypothetical protein [Austropuccinia psidii MF-1]